VTTKIGGRGEEKKERKEAEGGEAMQLVRTAGTVHDVLC